MRHFFIFIFIVFVLCGHAQAPYAGVDSVRNIRWVNDVTMFFADVNGNDSVPSNYVRTEFDLTNYDRILVMVCGKKELLYGTGDMGVPPQFLHKVKTSSETRLKPKGNNFPLPDSVIQVDLKGLEQFYFDKKDSLKMDTLQVSDYRAFDFNEFSNYSHKTYECSYKYNLKDGVERGYYKISELKDICVNDHFRLKYEGKWKKGEKNGDWKEYDKTGKLISVKKYKQGILKNEKRY